MCVKQREMVTGGCMCAERREMVRVGTEGTFIIRHSVGAKWCQITEAVGLWSDS